jgi:ADP-dependent NAD(P)H-hydrate dehydratase / NAD(P)H-hydrate epimerase
MLKVLTSSQIQSVDQATMLAEPISSTDLMERASRVFSDWFKSKYGKEKPVLVVSGTGNNGGDGLAVARHLHDAGYSVSIRVVWLHETGSVDFRINLERLERLHLDQDQVKQIADWKSFDSEVWVIDALLGSGLNRPLDGLAQAVAEQLNASNAPVISIDIPSGMSSDHPSTGTVVHAIDCLSFEIPKKALLLPDSAVHCRSWTTLPIGWLKGAADQLSCRDYYLQAEDLKSVLPLRKQFAHKGDHGHVVIAGGNKGMRGAAWLGALAALRSGAGLVSAWLTGSGPDYCPVTPEIMHIENPGGLWSKAVFAAGPGMGQSDVAKAQLREVLKHAAIPPILDADALNMIAADSDLMKAIPRHSILTPHPGEFARLFGHSPNGFERIDTLRAVAQQLECVIILKGAFSCVAAPDGAIYFNSSGNPGMATAGSGDVLTGIIAALRAQNLDAVTAAWAGVLWHGLAGDQAALHKGQVGLIASDLIEALPSVRQNLTSGQAIKH